MAEFFDPMGDLLAEQAQVDVLVQDFSEEDWNKMGVVLHDVEIERRNRPHCVFRLLRRGIA